REIAPSGPSLGAHSPRSHRQRCEQCKKERGARDAEPDLDVVRPVDDDPDDHDCGEPEEQADDDQRQKPAAGGPLQRREAQPGSVGAATSFVTGMPYRLSASASSSSKSGDAPGSRANRISSAGNSRRASSAAWIGSCEPTFPPLAVTPSTAASSASVSSGGVCAFQ